MASNDQKTTRKASPKKRSKTPKKKASRKKSTKKAKKASKKTTRKAGGGKVEATRRDPEEQRSPRLGSALRPATLQEGTAAADLLEATPGPQVAEVSPPALEANSSCSDPLDRFFFRPERAGLEPALAALRAAPEAGWHDSEAKEAEAYLTFRMADEWYVVRIVALQEIVRPLPLTPVPRTPEHVMGVVTLRGTVLPVLDLHLRLGLPRPDLGRTTRLLVLDASEGPAGFVVEEVGGVWRPEAPGHEAPPPSLGVRGDLIETLLREEAQVLPLLDLETALAVDLVGTESGRLR